MSYSRLFLVRFEPLGRSAAVSPGTSLLEAARRAGIPLASNCNGQGECQECGVTILDGQLSNLTDDEVACRLEGSLSPQDRLACCARILGPVQVQILNSSTAQPGANPLHNEIDSSTFQA